MEGENLDLDDADGVDDIAEDIGDGDEYLDMAKYLPEFFEQCEEQLSSSPAYHRGPKPRNEGNGSERRE